MKCEKCGGAMIKGKIISSSPSFTGASIVFRREENCKKIFDRSQVQMANVAEAYYCETCERAVAIYEKEKSIFE